jgi:hypothetical protein
MANKITNTNISARKFIPNTSRYSDSKVIYYGENNLLTFETYKKPSIETSSRDRFYVIGPGEEFRPDLVSKKAFNTEDFWWKILEFNNIKDIFDFTVGKTIRIPSNSNF